jgi:hypothetical protein
MRIGLSFDVEDLDQGTTRPLAGTDLPSSRAFVAQTDELLELLEAKGARATFFVVGSLVPGCLDLVKRIHRAGHEVGIHGYEHRRLAELTPAQFLREMRLVRDLVQTATSAPVLGYRAPFLSLEPRTRWLVDALGELGFVYDSSLGPKSRSSVVTGGATASDVFRFPNGIYEVPVTMASLGPVQRLPCGGGYFRWLPYEWSRGAIAAASGCAVVYFHNYEFHEGRADERSRAFDRIGRGFGLWLRLLLGSGGSGRSFRTKFDRLLNEFEACALHELLPESFAARGRGAGREAPPLVAVPSADAGGAAGRLLGAQVSRAGGGTYPP